MERTYTLQALEDGHLRLDKTGKSERIIYAASNRTERWSDPEEKVRAEFYAELIYTDIRRSGSVWKLLAPCH
jgi:type I restriction enzyme M protein